MTPLNRVRRALARPLYPQPLHAATYAFADIGLRPYIRSDVRLWAEVVNDPATRAGLDWPERSPREVAAHLNARRYHNHLTRQDDFLALAGVTRWGGYFGDGSMHLRNEGGGDWFAELGWIIHPQFRHYRFGTRLADALLAIAFTELRVPIVEARVNEGNEASARLAAAVGMHQHSDGPDGVLLFRATQATWVAAGGRPDLLRKGSIDV